ncbi:MAG TPA: glycerol-3-phosphate dehydrogenase [Alphaproteobacteria bacterium]|nr:glycerol-3-phosphate dehydrogenase [Alphaproteobacteria bacterium]
MDYDLCVIGGGINGVGIARDAAGRGLSVLLVEAQDLAGATSSASTKLVHGGLRYLESYDFKLVKESLAERETLLKAAPHIIWPMKFVLPHDSHLRPYWMIRAGLFLYDHLSGRKKLSKSEALDFGASSLADPLDDKYDRGFAYSDCWADDARLVVLNAIDAFERGAVIMPRTACVFLESTRDKKGWNLHLQNMLNGDEFQVTAGMVVNAAGPWVRSLLDGSELTKTAEGESDHVPHVRLVKGSHIIVPKIHDGAQSFILQQPDGRIVFALPYEKTYTLIGTTDVPFEGNASDVMISPEETTYLCDAVNRSFKKKIKPEDVIWTYSGVRSLVDDGKKNASKVTRDYKLYMDERFGPPILSVFGGKLTTYRHLAEHAVDRLATFHPKRQLLPWTQDAILPGGDIPQGDFDKFLQNQKARYTFLPDALTYRYARAYGSRMSAIMEGVNKVADLGTHYGDHIYEAEILYLLRYEFAHTAEDILWRRSKMGLHVSDKTVTALEKALPSLIERVQGESKRYENASGY